MQAWKIVWWCENKTCVQDDAFVMYGQVGFIQRNMPFAGVRQVSVRNWDGNAKDWVVVKPLCTGLRIMLGAETVTTVVFWR